MGILDVMKGLLGMGGAPGVSGSDQGLYYYVRCGRCGDIVEIRINRANELSELSDVLDPGEQRPHSGARFALTKGIIDSKCFRPMTLRVWYDDQRREIQRTVDGGEVVERADYEALHPPRHDERL